MGEDIPPSPWLPVSIALCLLLLQAAFVAAEVAVLATGTVRARRLASEGGRAGRLLAAILTNRARLFSTVLVAITALGYSAEALVTLAADRLSPSVGHYVGLAAVALFAMIFVEALPVTIAARIPSRLALMTAPLVWLASLVLWPVVTLFTALANGLLRLVGAIRRDSPAMTEEEMISLIEESEVQEDEKSMLRRVFDFGHRTVEEVMVPRVDMVCVEENQSIEVAMGMMLAHRHSRLPVYRGVPDRIVGVLHSKDLLPHLAAGERSTPALQVMREPHFVYEKRSVQELLREFQQHRRLMAVVTDEYGGTAGLVTLEDAVEELVGEIFDEYDLAEAATRAIGENDFLIEGSTPVHDICRDLEITLPDGDYETVSGLVQAYLGHLAEPGEVVLLDNGIRIEVVEADDQRIRTVRLERPAPVGEDGHDGDQEPKDA